VKTVFDDSIASALGLDVALVPGATPKKPYSGLMARKVPSGPIVIQQMSSPMVATVQPERLGTSMARLVLPHAEGKAPAMKLTSPAGEVSFRISMCSASQPSSRATAEAIRSDRHFLPSKALPP